MWYYCSDSPFCQPTFRSPSRCETAVSVIKLCTATFVQHRVLWIITSWGLSYFLRWVYTHHHIPNLHKSRKFSGDRQTEDATSPHELPERVRPLLTFCLVLYMKPVDKIRPSANSSFDLWRGNMKMISLFSVLMQDWEAKVSYLNFFRNVYVE